MRMRTQMLKVVFDFLFANTAMQRDIILRFLNLIFWFDFFNEIEAAGTRIKRRMFFLFFFDLLVKLFKVFNWRLFKLLKQLWLLVQLLDVAFRVDHCVC